MLLFSWVFYLYVILIMMADVPFLPLFDCKQRHFRVAQVEDVVHLQHTLFLAGVVDLRLLLFVVRRGIVGFSPKGSEVGLQCRSDRCYRGNKLRVTVTPLSTTTGAGCFFICACSNDCCKEPKECPFLCWCIGGSSPYCL